MKSNLGFSIVFIDAKIAFVNNNVIIINDEDTYLNMCDGKPSKTEEVDHTFKM